MEDLNVRIVRLAPMRVASAYGFGASPRGWRGGTCWTGRRRAGCWTMNRRRVLRVQQPQPIGGSPNYGYEQWMTVGPDVAGSGEVTIKEFAGGLYAVTRCKGLQTITDTWHRLATWCEGSPYVMGQHQWLEECFTPDAARLEDYVFDLYLPIAGRSDSSDFELSSVA